jgi:hypothetical protein
VRCLSAYLLLAVRELARAVQGCSPLGAYAGPLSSLKHLTSIEPIAKALVALPSFLPDLAANTGKCERQGVWMFVKQSFVCVLSMEGVRTASAPRHHCSDPWV